MCYETSVTGCRQAYARTVLSVPDLAHIPPKRKLDPRSVDSAPSLAENPHSLRVVADVGPVKRRTIVAVAGIDVGSCFKKHMHDLVTVVNGCD